MVRLPVEMKAFVADQSERNGSSQNSEIIRCIRERMEKVRPQAATGTSPN
ncbi:Arc family DNA-binding protein [Rhizobium beringeri]|uniref:Arc family DNA-binding protein n=1 Tax=Rhizobium beringeri TaxID=3019934 RepID=A0ABY1Y3Q9_9HYPH|nr:Arc family DNA-binding protein [Rhizobium beringeri]TBE73766.1 Arc family DNA-binding protein [Rhizobium beringeri]